MDNLEKRTRRKASGISGKPESSSYPIMRKDSDMNEKNENMQKREVRRIKGVSAPAAGGSLFSDAPTAPGRPAQMTPSVTELVCASLRYKWTMLVIFVLVATPMSVLSWTQFAPQYLARGEVRIRPIIPSLVFSTDDNGAIPFYQSFVNTQISIMEGATVLRRVLDQAEVRETEWFKNLPKSPMQKLTGSTPTRIALLKSSLLVSARRETEIVDVAFSAGSLKDAKAITNAALDQYIQYAKETSEASKDSLYKQLSRQHKNLETEIGVLEKTAATTRKRLGTHNPQALITAQRMNLEEMQADLRDVKQRIKLLEYEVGPTSAADATGDGAEVAAGTPARMENQAAYHEDVVWTQLDANARAVRHQCVNSGYTANHPDMRKLFKDLEFTEGLLRLHEARLDEQWGRRQIISAAGSPVTVTGVVGPGYNVEIGSYPVEHQLLLAREEGRLLNLQVEGQLDSFKKLFDDAQLLDTQNNDILHKRELFAAVQLRLDQKKMERGVPGSIEILTRASGAPEPSSDRRVTFASVGVFMGLAMSFGVAFLRASRNQTIYAFNDMPPMLQAPFLGYIPLTHIRRPLGRSLHDEIQRIRDDKIESVRLVRTALLSQLDGQGFTSVLIASAAEGTGKSTFTTMLGKSLAQSGKKVVMIDADLRRMTLSKRFGLSDEPGFMESLRSKSVDQQYIFSTETPGLSILSAGTPNGDGTVFEGTANGAFKACIGQLRKHFDIVLLDSSPILPVADTTILSSQVDGTIMVERELVSQRGNVIEALARLDSAGGRLMGTVFIGSSSSRNCGGSYAHRHGSSTARYA